MSVQDQFPKDGCRVATESAVPSLPFQVRVLESGGPGPVTGTAKDFTCLLPATIRTRDDNVVVPTLADPSFLENDLLVRRLNAAQKYFFLVGRPMPPRPLHHQVMMQRDIIVTEDVEHHLVWAKSRIFVKPLPAYLLDPDFWLTHLLAGNGEEKRLGDLEACARGFLFSYCGLIAHHSDYRMARDMGLLPKSVTWEGWKQLAAQVLSNHCYASVNPRYWYGELRLSRLNKIYQLTKGSPLRGYSRVAAHIVYADLLSDNFAALASILAYVAIVLTAMQVGLATERLQPSEAFQNASYGFTVFSIVAPLIAVAGIFMAVMIMIISNWNATKSYEAKRFRDMGVEANWRAKRGGGKGASD